MFLKISSTLRILLFIGNLFLILPAMAQQDSLFLSVEQLFESGVKSSLRLQADSLKERMAYERKRMPKRPCSPTWKSVSKEGLSDNLWSFRKGFPIRPIRTLPTGRKTIRSTSTNRCIREEKSAIPSVRQISKKKLQACND